MNSEPIKFLLVDDTEENLVALEPLLRRDGLELLLARSGSEALELLLKHDVSLVLLDVQMPVMDGLAATRLIRDQSKRIGRPIIIALTADAMPEDRDKCMRAGMDDYLSKPISSKRLTEMLEKHGPNATR